MLVLEKSYHLYYKFEDKEVLFIDQQKDILSEKITNLLMKTGWPEERVILNYLLDLVTFIYETVSPIFSVSMKEELATLN